MTTLSTSTTVTSALWTGYAKPVTVNGGSEGSVVTITISEDLTLDSINDYIIIASQYVTVDGSNNTITVAAGVSNYAGFIQNSSYDNINIQNFTFTREDNTATSTTRGAWVQIGRAHV